VRRLRVWWRMRQLRTVAVHLDRARVYLHASALYTPEERRAGHFALRAWRAQRDQLVLEIAQVRNG
jgi:hypothetical protein